jgi:hypothetical protein
MDDVLSRRYFDPHALHIRSRIATSHHRLMAGTKHGLVDSNTNNHFEGGVPENPRFRGTGLD